MSQQAQVENNNNLLLRSLEPNTNSVSTISATTSTTSTNGVSKLPLRKRIGPVLKWQPVETPDEHYKAPPLTSTKSSTHSPTTTSSVYPINNQQYPQQQYNEDVLMEEKSESSDQECKLNNKSLQKKIKQENSIKRSSNQDDVASNHSSPSSRPTKKVKRGRPPLQKNGSTTESLPTTPTTTTTPSTPAAALQSSSSTRVPPQPTTTTAADNAIDTSVLYCICKRPYDVPRFMIACDKCDQWFHGECIQISEKQGEFIDLYFCEPCAKITGKKTSWKPQCANPSCGKAARIGTHQGNLSKYCTDTCGMQIARARIEQAEQKKRLVLGNSPPASTTTVNGVANDSYMNPLLTRSKLSSFADMDDRSRLIRVKDEKLHAKFIISIGEHKSALLSLLIQHQKEDVCGFDSRLSWSDTMWEKVASVEQVEDGSMLIKDNQGTLIQPNSSKVCQQHRKCNKHLNWQKLKLAELEQERSEQFVILTMLERERQQIKARMKKRREEVDLIDFLENGTIHHSSYALK